MRAQPFSARVAVRFRVLLRVSFFRNLELCLKRFYFSAHPLNPPPAAAR